MSRGFRVFSEGGLRGDWNLNFGSLFILFLYLSGVSLSLSRSLRQRNLTWRWRCSSREGFSLLLDSHPSGVGGGLEGFFWGRETSLGGSWRASRFPILDVTDPGSSLSGEGAYGLVEHPEESGCPERDHRPLKIQVVRMIFPPTRTHNRSRSPR